MFNVESYHEDQINYVDDGKTDFDAFKPMYGYPSREEVILMQFTG